MSELAINGITASTSEHVPGVLAQEERRRISVRLGAGLVGIGLLCGRFWCISSPSSGRSVSFAGDWPRRLWGFPHSYLVSAAW
jgi:hypothetical protein